MNFDFRGVAPRATPSPSGRTRTMFRPAHLRTLWRTAHCEPASYMHPLTLPAGRMWRAGRRRRGLPAGQVPVVATRGGDNGICHLGAAHAVGAADHGGTA